MDAMETARRNSLLHRLLGRLHTLSGWFLFYLAIGGLIGFAVTHPQPSEPSCLPYIDMFGVIESACSQRAVDFFWSFTIGWPRFLIVFPAIAVSLLKAGFNNGWSSRIFDGTVFLLYSVPVFLLVWAGTLYWWRRYRFVCIMAVAMVVLVVLTLGFME